MSINYEQENDPSENAIEQDKYRLSDEGEIVETTGMGSCFGVIIYNPDIRKAFIGHFSDPIMTNDFTEMINKAKDFFSDNIKTIKVYVGGGGPTVAEAKSFKYTKKKRAFVEGELTKAGFLNIEKKYINDLSESVILRINTETGLVEWDIE